MVHRDFLFCLRTCIFGIVISIVSTGCLLSPVEQSGGPGSTTVTNSNALAIFQAAREVFVSNGYSLGPARFPDSIAFDRPAGRMGQLVFGSTMRPVAFRIQIAVNPIPGTQDFRLVPRVMRVESAGRTAFESETKMLRMWNAQLRPVMREIRDRATGVGRM